MGLVRKTVLLAWVAVMGFAFASCPANNGTRRHIGGRVDIIIPNDGRDFLVPFVGDILKADFSYVTGSGDLTFQWRHGDGQYRYPADAYHEVGEDDLGYPISVVVFRSGYVGAIISDPTFPVLRNGNNTPELPVDVVGVVARGPAVVGLQLVAELTGPWPPEPEDVLFQWRRSRHTAEDNENAIDGPFDAIHGADGEVYRLRMADLDHYIKVIAAHRGHWGYVESSPPLGPVVLDGGEADGSLEISFADFDPELELDVGEDATLSILDRSLWIRLIEYPADSTVRWLFGDNEVGEGTSFHFTHHHHRERLGPHFITLEVEIEERRYSRVVTIELTI